MKKVLIIGASGSLVQYVIEALNQQSEIALTLLLRNKSRLADKAMPAEIVILEGDVMDYVKLKEAERGKDIV